MKAEEFLARCRKVHGVTEEQSKDWTCETDEDGTLIVRNRSGMCVALLAPEGYCYWNPFLRANP